MKKILITAGPTREKIDPIRFITNSSTGRIGYLLAELARKKGFKVILITGPTFLRPPKGIKVICIESAKELKKEVLRHISQVDCLIMAAAVGDYRPLRIKMRKIKRRKELILPLMR
ncbi:MAG: bifunctional 4'-phosphopantothenoylcysteine decarboxylase/phosphopantothenoylcysteine synthetase, partial [Elusimicrobia bacterium CG02_land_8_20_14_3_00_37_13]